MKLIKGVNDFMSCYPEQAEEWDFEKNKGINPNEVTYGSGKYVWWKCKKCAHSWKAKICDRRTRGCPVCAGKKAIRGLNDFKTEYSDLAKEWSYEDNHNIFPYEYVSGSHKKVFWKCAVCNNVWRAEIRERVAGTGCPKCNKLYSTSFPEQAIFHYVKQIFPTAGNKYSPDWLNGKEIDVWIPERNIAIEYDGRHWHKDSIRDTEKGKLIKSKGITFYRIREVGCPDVKDGSTVIWLKAGDIESLECAIQELLFYLDKKDHIISVKEDRNSIYSSYIITRKNNSLASKRPDVLSKWDYEKNGDLKPDMILPNSSIKVWWKCEKCGYESFDSVYKKATYGCGVCANLVIVKGINDLETLRPDLIEEWSYEKNQGIYPCDFSVGSSKKVWWKCKKCNGEWKASIKDRVSGHGCSKCAYQINAEKRQICATKGGKNSLAAVYPQIAKEWDYEKNCPIIPENVSSGSSQTYYWKCSICGCSWSAKVLTRKNGHGCPECYKRNRGNISHKSRLKAGKNTLAAVNPLLAEEWNYQLNGEITPFMVTPSSSTKVFWTCKCCGNVWKATIGNRNYGSGCPKCARKKH